MEEVRDTKRDYEAESASNQTNNNDDNKGPAQMDVEEAPMVPAGTDGVTHEEHDTVTFVEEGPVVESETTESLKKGESAQVAITHDLISILSRPIRVGDFKFDTQGINGGVHFMRLPQIWLNNSMIKAKLEGFKFLRCKFTIRYQVNAQPFQQGRLLAWYNPLGATMKYQPSSTKSLQGITGYPHVELDFSAGTAAELEIPYHAMISHYDLTRGYGTAGSVNLVCMSPTSSPVYGTVWVSAKEIDLQVATHDPMANVQIGTEEKTRPGNIETMSRHVARIASAASKIPGIGMASGTVSAVADAVSGVASIFGFSKPVDPEFVTTTDPTIGRFVSNYNGDVKRKNFALDARNEVAIQPSVFGTTQDEMSLKYVAGKSCYWTRFSWDKTALEGTVLGIYPVSPFSVKETIQRVMSMTLVSYVAMLFQYWRGAMKYRISIVKTNYHSGRFRVFFTPGVGFAKSDTKDTEVSMTYSKIFDLRDGYEFEFEIPYVHFNYWCERQESIGTFTFEVINTLVAPDNVSPKIDVLIYAGAGDDMEFGVPNINREYIPRNGAEAIPAAPEPNVQSNTDFIPISRTENFDGVNYTTGEVITSFRQILKRYEPMGPLVDAAGTGWLPTVDRQQYQTLPLASRQITYHTLIERLYRFWTGSVNMLVAVSPTLSTEPPHTVELFYKTPYNASTPEPLSQTLRGSHPHTFFFPRIEGMVELGIPYYKPNPILPTSLGAIEPSLYPPAAGGFRSVPLTTCTVVPNLSGSVGADALLAQRAIGEDFSYGFLVGAPQVFDMG